MVTTASHSSTAATAASVTLTWNETDGMKNVIQQKDGTIGNDLVIKPVPSSIKFQASDPIKASASSGSASVLQFKPDQGIGDGLSSSSSLPLFFLLLFCLTIRSHSDRG